MTSSMADRAMPRVVDVGDLQAMADSGFPGCCVYVVREQRGKWAKVGTSAAPLARITSLQSGNPRRLRLSLVVATGSKRRALEIESMAKAELPGVHDRGDWFTDGDELERWLRGVARD